MIDCDAVGPVIESNLGNKYILVAVDYLTRWSATMSVKDITEETTATYLVDCIIQYYGVPQFILTDRGPNFTSRYVKDWDKKSSAVLMALRMMKSEGTGFTSGRLLFDYNLKTPEN